MKNTLYQQVADRMLTLIHNGVLKEGDKIPSIRQLSDELNVSINTIKEAYCKLESQNYIKAVPQSGFYVKKQSAEWPEPPVMDPRHLDPQEISLCQIYGAFQSEDQCITETSLSIAALDRELWPTKKMGRFFQDAICDHEYDSYNYLMSPGYLPLREQIAKLGLSSSLNLSPEDIVITNGCTEAIFLALMVICKPGDTVVFESPIYFNLLHLLQKLNLKLIEIPAACGEGIHLDTLRFAIEQYPVRVVFSISNFNNPSGFMMPRWKKEKLVQLMAEYDIPLIEDDVYGDLSFQERPDTCKTYDTEGNVILCSSFSKTIAPGLRVGWIAPGKYYDQIVKMKTLLNISTASVNQIAVAKFLKIGGYERHLRNLRKKLQEQIFAMRSCILCHFPKGTKVTQPDGGILLWVELPKPADTDVIYQKSLSRNILIAPGRLFSMKDKYSNCMRLNAGIWNEHVEKAVKELGELCGQYQDSDYETASISVLQ